MTLSWLGCHVGNNPLPALVHQNVMFMGMEAQRIHASKCSILESDLVLNSKFSTHHCIAYGAPQNILPH